MWTKQQIVQEAFGELALQGFVFNVGPDEMVSALRRLDLFMATMQAKKLFLTYAFPANPSDGSQLDDPSGLPDSDIEAVVLNLAPRIAGNFGKTMAPSSLATAKAALDTVMIAAAQPLQVAYPSTMPRGAGNKPWRWSQYQTFFPPVNEAVPTVTP